MALDSRQQHQVRVELEQHFALAGLTDEEAAADLGWDIARVRRTIELAHGAEPVDVWQLRDYIARAVKDAGHHPTFTVLTSGNRLRARLWFGLRPAPRRGASTP